MSSLPSIRNFILWNSSRSIDIEKTFKVKIFKLSLIFNLSESQPNYSGGFV